MSIEVKLESVSVELGGSTILDRIALTVEPGEFLTLLGPSGSGKSTTLNVVAGFVRPVEGAVLLDGEVVDRVPPHRRDLGFVFQSYALFPHLTVKENVAYPLRTRRADRGTRAERVAWALGLMQLGDLAKRNVSSLSGGQQQRVALARALVFEPRVLLLDEPLGALDRQLRESMQTELKRIQDEVGVTTIGVTHDQVEAMTMSDRIAIMNGGRIEQIGTPEQLYKQPATLFVARFLGEANLLPLDDAGNVPHLDLQLGIEGGGTALIRPEDLAICADAAAECRARGVVDDVSYQGTRYQLKVRLSDRQELMISERVNGSRAPAAGDSVGITCLGERPHVISERAGGTE